MGWLIYNHVPASIRDEIARLCGGEDDENRNYPVLVTRQGAVWYAAVRSEPKNGQRRESGLCPYGAYETDATGGYVFAAIFLTTTGGGEWGYKSMEVQKASLVLLSEIIFVLIIGFMFFGEVPTLNAVIGGLLVLVALIIPNLDFGKYRFTLKKV